MKLENHLPPEIYRFYDHLFLEDREFLEDVKFIYSSYLFLSSIENKSYSSLSINPQ